MTRPFYLVAAAVAFIASTPARTADQVSMSANGWTITADPGQGRLTIARDELGILMRDVRLGLRGARAFSEWTAEKKEGNRLSIKTDQPRTGWRLELTPEALIVSSTANDSVLTAEVPASSDRIVARTMDSQGTPVDWIGTQEVAEGYGGEVTHNRSYLPRQNADVLYFALGQVSASTLHSLFDRKTDTAINFTSDTTLTRSTNDSGVLALTMPVPGNSIVRIIPEYFTKMLGVPYYVPFDDSVFSRAPMVWSSWTSYYDAVREEDIVKNADWLAANLKAYGFQFVQLDDGYDRDAKGQHYWIENWDRQKFPHGPQWLTSYVKSKGLGAGIWLVPNAYAGAVQQHPDWYLHYKKDGRIVRDYNTPAMDATNPQALEQVKKIMTTLDDWGFDYYKFDGEHALARYIPGIDHNKLYDPNVDSLANYRARLKMIRETIGPNRFIEGCPAGTPLNGIGYFDSYFTGHDLYNNWQGMYPLFSSISANGFLNHMVVYVMPGEGLELGTPMTVDVARVKRPEIVVDTARTREDPMIGFGLNDAEARTVVTYVALTGVVYPLASVMSELPPQRVQLLKQTMPTLPILPIDLFSRGTDMRWNTFKHTQADYYIHNYPEILDLKVNSAAGAYDVVGLTNWRSAPATRTLKFADKLGLEPGQEYIAFDFWKQELLGTFRDSLQTEVGPHDTRVLLIHPRLGHPQVIGNSRHISGAYSVNELSWDPAAKQLRGTSETVAGDQYTLFVHVPQGYKQLGARTSAGVASVREGSEPGMLRVAFQGQSEPVKWVIEFAKH
ncbi:MAG TPA: alpha-galactosidase [Bryobacteraceae bacterium]|nr:alpha-galactosidase [Bryobacteraceae bacterium]